MPIAITITWCACAAAAPRSLKIPQVLAAGEAAASRHGFRLVECVLSVRALCPGCVALERA